MGDIVSLEQGRSRILAGKGVVCLARLVIAI